MFDMTKIMENYALPWGIKIITALAIYIIGRWVVKIALRLVRKVLNKGKMDEMLIDFVLSIANALAILFIIIAALSQLGVDTTSLVALIGAAGLAVGLALQNSLSNFAAGVMLIIFKPFKVGDFIQAAGESGVVETVNIFTTSIKTGDNKLILIPNATIYNGNITNFSVKDTRRIDMVFGIGYDDDIRLAKSILEKIINEDARIFKDPKPVIALSELGDSSVNFIVRPWAKSSDYWQILWDTNEKVKIEFDANNISIPYPQMDVHINQTNATETV